MRNKGIIVLLSLVMIGVIFGSVVGTFNFLKISDLKTGFEESMKSEETTEDDVLIAGKYKIVSTLPISNAYKSGDTSVLSAEEKETLVMAEKLLNSLVNDGMTAYEKEIAVFTYMMNEINNKKDSLVIDGTVSKAEGAPFGVLKTGDAVCVGYATTFRLLMQMLDIKCMVVHDFAISHSWNMVQLEGEWYHVDCYFASNEHNYSSFNMNDALCSYSHDWDTGFFPVATGTKYNYAVVNAETIENVWAIPEWYYNNKVTGKSCCSCRFEEEITEDEEAIANYIATTICNGLSYIEDAAWYDIRWIKDDTGKYVLIINYVDNGVNSENSLTDEQIEKANEYIFDYFPEAEHLEVGLGYYYEEEIYG